MPKKSLRAENDDDKGDCTPGTGEAFYRSTSDFWMFWEMCSQKPCKRAHRCVGDVHLCRTKHLQVVSVEARAWLHAVLDALMAGLSTEEALAIGREVFAETSIASGRPAGDAPPQPPWPVEPGR